MKKSESIRKKILKSTLAVSLSGLLLALLVSTFIQLSTRLNINQQGISMGDIAADSSASALEQQVMSELLTLSNGLAAQADEKLATIQSQTIMVANVASYIYSNPEKYTGRGAEVDYLKEDQVGRFALHIKTAPGVTKEQIQPELDLISYLAPVLEHVKNVELNIVASYIGSPSGFQLSADLIPKEPMNTNYPVTERNWYKGAVAADGIFWSLPVADASNRGVGITCSMPFYNTAGGKRELAGVATSGAMLDSIKNIISNVGVGETGHSFIVDSNFSIIITDEPMEIVDGKVVYKNLAQNNDPGIQAVLTELSTAKSGVRRVKLDADAGEQLMAYTPLTTIPWSIITVVDVDEVLQPSQKISNDIHTLSSNMVSQLNSQAGSMLVLMLLFVPLMGLLTVLLTRRLTKQLTDPIVSLTKTVKLISMGELDYPHGMITTGDEIQTLSEGFEQMLLALQRYIDNLTAVTAEKERISAELEIATQIQASMLPCSFPAFPTHSEFDIYATMQPAKEVGGDFYDFFLVDDTHLAVVMADVSGKGVPAALFMVIAKTLIKNHTQAGLPANEVFNRVNRQLCENNDAALFVTAWMGILELGTGKFTYVNAGHNPPLLLRKGGSYEYLHSRPGFVLAGMDTVRYKQSEMELLPGDRLYLYTDGVTEAINAAEELYGEERLLASINAHSNLPPHRLLPAIKSDLDGFVNGAPQFDDITMLNLTISEEAHSPMKTITVAANVNELDIVLAFVEGALKQRDCPMSAQIEIAIAVEEIFVNIAHYAYNPAEGKATIRCEVTENPLSIIIQFLDNGVPYNPLDKPDPNVTLDAAERGIGGLGIFMVKKSMDCVDYCYEGGKNILTIKKSF